MITEGLDLEYRSIRQLLAPRNQSSLNVMPDRDLSLTSFTMTIVTASVRICRQVENDATVIDVQSNTEI